MINRRLLAFTALMTVVIAGPTSTASAQDSRAFDAGIHSRWVDGEIRTVRDAAAGWTVRSLTLLPLDTRGRPSGLTLVWHAYFTGGATEGAPAAVELRAYAGALADQRIQRQTDIVLALDEGTPLGMHLRYGGRGGFVGFITPGGEIAFSTAQLPFVELESLLFAQTIGGQALGFEFSLTPQQRQTLQRYLRAFFPET